MIEFSRFIAFRFIRLFVLPFAWPAAEYGELPREEPFCREEFSEELGNEELGREEFGREELGRVPFCRAAG